MTTTYNYLYNGNNLLDHGKKEFNNSFSDDFWAILPVEKIYSSSLDLDERNNKSDAFTNSEEKAVMAIQKHAMNIGGKEKNPSMDEAYFLLGESRYYDQRFIPSLEAFNYILFKYPTSELVNKAKIWKEKINIQLNNNELAINNLNKIKNKGKLSKEDILGLNSALSQAYLNTQKLDSAIFSLKIASNISNNVNQKSRFLFIIGQLYAQLEKKDTSSLYYDRIIKFHRKIPREYYVNAFIEKSKNYEKLDLGIDELNELIKDIENNFFLGDIYHQIGNLYFNTKQDSLAILNYNNSLRNPSKNNKINVRNYNILADYFFDQNEYLKSAAYYDSTIQNINNNKKLLRKITKKRNSLDDVIFYELSAARNDSIVELTNMSIKDQEDYFNNYINELKKKDEKKNNQLLNNTIISNSFSKNLDKNKSKPAVFYFYNPTAVAFGKNEFKRIWGKKKLSDNWKENKQQNLSKNPLEKEPALKENQLNFTIEDYLNSVPTNPKTIDSIKSELDYAYFQLASIYSSKFSKYNLSNKKILMINFTNNDPKTILPAKYLLYRNYLKLGEQENFLRVKNEIIQNFPKSKYAEILSNSKASNKNSFNNILEEYSKAFLHFQNQEYFTANEILDRLSNSYPLDPLIPKIELLKASLYAKVFGYSNYKEQLKFISKNYPNSLEGKEAKIVLEEVLPEVKKSTFELKDAGENFKIVFLIEEPNEKLEEFKSKLLTKIKEVENIELNFSEDFYIYDKRLIIVHGLKSFDGAEGYRIILNRDELIKEFVSTVVSSENYQIIQIHKNLELYLNNN